MAVDTCCPPLLVQSLVPGALLLASLLGSLHCVGMCGGLVVACTTKPADMGYYHAGRLLGYIGLGVMAGYIGLSLSGFSWMPYIMGGSFIAIALASFFKQNIHIPLPFSTHILSRIMTLKTKLSSSMFAGSIGLGSVLLPCGWLYAMVLAVSQTQSPVKAAFLMSMFWLGTLPALTLSPVLFKKFASYFKYPTPAIIYLAIGIYTMFIR